jgi:hypothetical protein
VRVDVVTYRCGFITCSSRLVVAQAKLFRANLLFAFNQLTRGFATRSIARERIDGALVGKIAFDGRGI